MKLLNTISVLSIAIFGGLVAGLTGTPSMYGYSIISTILVSATLDNGSGKSKKHIFYLVISALSFGLSIYTNNPEFYSSYLDIVFSIFIISLIAGSVSVSND